MRRAITPEALGKLLHLAGIVDGTVPFWRAGLIVVHVTLNNGMIPARQIIRAPRSF